MATPRRRRWPAAAAPVDAVLADGTNDVEEEADEDKNGETDDDEDKEEAKTDFSGDENTAAEEGSPPPTADDDEDETSLRNSSPPWWRPRSWCWCRYGPDVDEQLAPFVSVHVIKAKETRKVHDDDEVQRTR